MMLRTESLVDVVTRLGGLLKRRDLTDYERQRYETDLLKLTTKCLTMSGLTRGQDVQILLDMVHQSPRAEIC
jgi:hypothetical protein